MVEPCHGKEAIGIDFSGMGRVENKGGDRPPRADSFKGWLIPIIGSHAFPPLRSARRRDFAHSSFALRDQIVQFVAQLACGVPVKNCLWSRVVAKLHNWHKYRRNSDSPLKTTSGMLMKRILLAEDDNDMRQFLTRALKNAGYDVVSFDNGLSAYERLREEPFSLLLSDIVMPEMDGIELARRATELDPDLKVMFITGFAAVALNPDSDAPKDASVLSKPFHLRDLVSEVERLLAA
jgi:two-component system cell cycle response regulator CpdR